MNIFIDESGSFAPTNNPGSWCVVAAMAAPESARKMIDTAVAGLRSRGSTSEVKLHELTDDQYLAFLKQLFEAGALLFAVATDSSDNATALIHEHRSHQVTNIRANIPRMKFEGGRKALTELADRLESLSDQLYVQIVCQVRLAHEVICRSISYFAQRHPATLRELRWRIDQKNNVKPIFEETFERIAPPLLQTYSFDEPILMVRGFDYSHMIDYEFQAGEFPTYLQEDHGLPPVEGFNLQKMLRKNLRFEDSKSCDGVQAADLLASGIRRLLRGKCQASSGVGQGLARLTLENQIGLHPIRLVSLARSALASQAAADAVRAMRAQSRPYLLPRSG